MLSFDPYDYPIRQRHQYIIGAVGPRPICWASTINDEGQPNLAPYSFFNAYSANPPILVFSSNRRGRDNTTKDTLHNIESNHEVVINVVPHSLVNQMTISSTDYDTSVNEFEKAGVTPIPSDEVAPFRMKESPVQFECKVKEVIALGTEGGAGNLFICEIVRMHIDENILDADQQIDPQKIDLVGRMGGSYYTRASGDAVFTIDNPFPKLNLGFDQLPAAIKESTVLTGNQLGVLAMETELPSAEAIKSFIAAHPNEAGLSIQEKHELAGGWVGNGKVAEALLLLLS